MREYKFSTAKGRKIYEMGVSCNSPSLAYLYDNWSLTKQKAFDRYCDECFKDNGTAFGVGNANKFSFTASWLLNIKGEEVLRVETKDNSYLVWLNR